MDNKADMSFINNLVNSKYGIIAVNKLNVLLEKMLNGKYDTGNVGAFYNEDNNQSVTFRVFKVDYKNSNNNSVNHDKIKARNNAVLYSFARWDALGYNKRRCKNPYKSKQFMEIYDNCVDNSETVYVLVNIEV